MDRQHPLDTTEKITSEATRKPKISTLDLGGSEQSQTVDTGTDQESYDGPQLAKGHQRPGTRKSGLMSSGMVTERKILDYMVTVR